MRIGKWVRAVSPDEGKTWTLGTGFLGSTFGPQALECLGLPHDTRTTGLYRHTAVTLGNKIEKWCL